MRNVLNTVREISKLIKFSLKRHLLDRALAGSNLPRAVTIKPLCPTRWTAQTAAIEAVLKYYSVLIEVMEEYHVTTHDKYGFILLGLELAHVLFGTSEEVSKSLQRTLNFKKPSSIKLASAFY